MKSQMYKNEYYFPRIVCLYTVQEEKPIIYQYIADTKKYTRRYITDFLQ